MTGRRVVVTGIGTINPPGISPYASFWDLEKGVSWNATVNPFDVKKFKTRFSSDVKY